MRYRGGWAAVVADVSGVNTDLLACLEQRDLTLSRLRLRKLREEKRLARQQQEELRRRKLKDEIARMRLSFAVMTEAELERHRADCQERVRQGRGWGTVSYRQTVAAEA